MPTETQALENADITCCPKHKNACFTTKVRLVKVYDGDTITVAYYEHRSETVQQISCRIKGYDTPEVRPSRSAPNRDTIKANAQRAKKVAVDFFAERTPIFDVGVVGYDKYGRWLIEEPDLKTLLIDQGLAYDYTGGTKIAHFGSTL